MRNIKYAIFIISLLMMMTFSLSSQATSDKYPVESSTIRSAVTFFFNTYENTGMAGAQEAVRSCFDKIDILGEFKYIAYCIAMDFAGFVFDQEVSKKEHFPPTEYFSKNNMMGRYVKILNWRGLNREEANIFGNKLQSIAEPIIMKKMYREHH